MIDMGDYQTLEDYAQFKEVLLAAGYSEDLADVIIRKYRRLATYREARLMESYRNKLPPPESKAPLACILYPDMKKLQSIPVFDRYIAYLISSRGRRNASKKLDISRMGLYSWLTRHGYISAWKAGQQSTRAS